MSAARTVMNDLNPIDAGQGELSTDVTTHDTTPSPAPTTPSPAPTADQLYEVKIGGHARKVPLNELLNGYQRQQDYTAKTMSLAEERRQLQSQWEAERTQTREFLSRPENVEQLLQYLRQKNGPQMDPSQPVNSQQLQQILQQREQVLREQQVQERAQMMQELELKQMEDSYKVDLQRHIAGILDQNPVLKSIHRIEYVLKQAAAEGQPGTIEEAKQLILHKAAEQADAIRAHFTEQQKQTAVQQSKLRGIEPPGGAAPMPAPKAVGRMGSPEFNADVADYLRKLSGS